MPNNPTPQSIQKIFTKQEHGLREEQSHHNLWQDKRARMRARVASRQPDARLIVMRSQRKESKGNRSQKKSGFNERLVQQTLWVKPGVRAELRWRAQQEGLSASAAGAAILEEGIRQKLHVQHAVLLQPIIEQAIRRQMRTMATRLAALLVRVAFDAGQTRSLVTNVLGRQPGVTPEDLNTILSNSSKTAKGNLKRKTPQLTELIAAVEKWMAQEREEEMPYGKWQ